MRDGFRSLALAAGALALSAGCNAPKTGSVPGAGPSTVPLFRDVADSAGVRYLWTIQGKRPLNILQTIGNGCAFLDYDQDGNLDILLVGHNPALYKGDGSGHFIDVTRGVGLDKLSGNFLGCAVGDYDNDGYPDIYLTAYRGGALLRNELQTVGASTSGNRRLPRIFRDVTLQAGLKPQPWSTSAAFVETVPRSGRLDLIVANYARFGQEPGIPQLCEQNSAHGGTVMTSCGPRHYTPLKSVLFRNKGGGRFAAPLTLSQVNGRGLGVAACDYDGSGNPAIAFANDETPGDLLRNVGLGPIQDIGAVSGMAYDRDGNAHGGMGLDWGDYDNDGRFDLIVATFQNEPKSLYHNDGSGFTDVAYPSGVGAVSYAGVAFGCKFLDYDNDGWLDLVFANGHVQDNIAQIDPNASYGQTLQLLHNSGPGDGGHPTFEDVSRRAGDDFARKIVGRGLAIGDFDNDGRIDILVVDSEGKPLLLHNLARTNHHWLGVRLIGVRSNREGYGAILTAQFGGRKLVRHCHADGSYMSSSDPRVLIGTGDANTVDELAVRWPSGQTDHFSSVLADRYITIREGRGMQR